MNLKSNLIDHFVSASKAISGTLSPEFGPILGEIIGSIVPNQRIDRIALFVQELDAKINLFPIEKVNKLLDNIEFIDLIEESFLQATRALTEERRNYIINIITNGIDSEQLEINQSKHLLRILSELNDIEIIWLRSYLDPGITRDLEFKEKHKDLLNINQYPLDEKNYFEYIISDSYKEHLERLGLIYNVISIDRKTDMPKFDRITGKPDSRSIRITTLGKLLLKEIGLCDDNILPPGLRLF